jgi:hypothetical protein
MNIKNKLLLSAIGVFLSGNIAYAMSSATYRIDADSINSGGGFSSSTGYTTTDTIGESFTDNMASASYKVGQGFPAMTTLGITLTLDSSTKTLTMVTPGTPVIATTTSTVTTDSWGGYDLYISENNDLKHTDTITTIPSYSGGTIATPIFWSGVGLGFTVASGTGVNAKWGTNPTYKFAAIPTISTIFHTKTGYTSGGDITSIQYKLDVPTSQKSGTYTNTVNYLVVAKL